MRMTPIDVALCRGRPGLRPAPAQKRRLVRRQFLTQIIREVPESREAPLPHAGQNGQAHLQPPSDHGTEAPAIGLLLGELVDDEQIGDVLEKGGLDPRHRRLQPAGVETAPGGGTPEILGNAQGVVWIGPKDVQVHMAFEARATLGIHLHGPGEAHALCNKRLGHRAEDPVPGPLPRRDHVSQHHPTLATLTQSLHSATVAGKRRRSPMKTNVDTMPLISPNPDHPGLTRVVAGTDQTGQPVETAVVEEQPLTIFLNGQEIVTAMTIGDYPEYLALGFLRNQGMLLPDDEVTGVDHDAEIETVVVRTARQTQYEEKLKKKTRTSGCAVGTVFGDIMEGIEEVVLPEAEVRTSWLYALARQINTTPSLYLKAGAIHGTVLCHRDRPLVFMEDVGRHNAVDKIAGYMFRHGVRGDDKILYTTGRLTSEMVIKTALMGIPVLASRSGFTAWGVEIARQVGLTLIGRMRGQRFVCLSGEARLMRDADPEAQAEEPSASRRKGSVRG